MIIALLTPESKDTIFCVYDKTSRQMQESQSNLFLNAKTPQPLATYGLVN
jgi:hypothetical protein